MTLDLINVLDCHQPRLRDPEGKDGVKIKIKKKLRQTISDLEKKFWTHSSPENGNTVVS